MGLWAYLKGEEPGLIERILKYKDKGQFGEYLLEYALSNDNLQGYSKTFTNLYIPYKGSTTEIDVLLLHEKGIFVFESKNYSGWIFGSESQQQWAQALPNKQKNQFYNPILQNRTHIKALSEYIGIDQSEIFSYIIFSERCELKKVPNDTEAYVILKRPAVLKRLRKILEERTIQYSQAKIDALAQKLKLTEDVSDEKKEQHVNVIAAKAEGRICSYCGAEMIERKGKHGAFLGCSNYPKCKFTRKITE